MRQLTEIRAPALDTLSRISRTSDLETVRRATELIVRIEEQLLVQHVLAPTKVRLKVDVLSVPDVVTELSRVTCGSRRSQYPSTSRTCDSIRWDFAEADRTLARVHSRSDLSPC